MFEFFEGIIEKIGVKLITDFSSKLLDFIKDVKSNSTNSNNDNGGYSAKIGSSGYSAKIGSSGYYAKIGSSGYSAKIGSSGYYAQIGSSGDSAKIGSSGDSAQIGSSGDSAKIGSSGDSAKIGSSGYSAKIGSSGYYAQIGSSGDSAKIGSSGDSAKIGSSGDSAKIGSSGDSAKIGSSGYYAQIGSSGNSAKIGSSGDSAKIGSSGYSAKIGSSGYSAKIGSSGYYAQIGSSGYYAQIGSSGNSAKIGSSGDSAKIGSSGDSAKIDISGAHSVGFAAGIDSIIKAKKGTWISLCEYKKDENDNWLPEFALSAQIGNKEYKDFKGRILKETEYYCLLNKKFYPVDVSDGIKTIKISEKKRDEITIIKGLSFQDYKTEVYIVKSGEFSAHGENLKQAMDDLLYKKTKSEETEKIVEEIKKTGKVNRAQYRAITGACQFGTEQFIQQHNIQDLEEIELSELRKILTLDNFGAEEFWRLIDEK